MKDYSIIKKRVCELSETVGESILDASGPTMQDVDYNFDLLRKKYDGTDFSKEANCMCDLMGMFASRCSDKDKLPFLVGSIGQMFRGDGFESPDDIMEKYSRFVDEVDMMLKNASKPSVMKSSKPDVKTAQAKLLELENYLNTSQLIKREKWQRYIDEARRMASVGDSSFDATPQQGQDDLEYINQNAREEQKKQQLFQSMVTA